MNTELFKKIDDRISIEGNLDMAAWEDSPATRDDDSPVCGTTRCVAGWAVYETTGKELYRPEGGFSDETIALAKERGGWREDDEEEARGGWVDFEVLGLALLGLGAEDRELFYGSEELAGRVVALFAAGQADEARRVLHGAR